jgi:hypothetical protein
LAIAALWSIFFDPGSPKGISNGAGQSFDGRYLLPGHFLHLDLARQDSLPLHVCRARAALAYSATVFSAGESKGVPEHPE